MLAHFHPRWSGRARQLCPGASDVDFLRDLDGVVDLNSEVAYRALDLGMSEQQLDGPQVAGPSIDQRGLGSPQRVRPELEGIEADAGGDGMLGGGPSATTVPNATAGRFDRQCPG